MGTGRPLMKVLNLGCMEYRRALRVQHRLAARLRTSQEQRELAPCSQHHLAAERGISEEPPAHNVLILVEHPPVYTTGIRTKACGLWRVLPKLNCDKYNRCTISGLHLFRLRFLFSILLEGVFQLCHLQ
jgi:hypothetical protein